MLDTFDSYCLLFVKLDPASTERSATAFLESINIDWSNRTSLEAAMRQGKSHFGVSGRWLYVTINDPSSFFNLSEGGQQVILECFNFSDMLLIYLGSNNSHGFASYSGGNCIRSTLQLNGVSSHETGQSLTVEHNSKGVTHLHQNLIEEFTEKVSIEHFNISFSMTGFKWLRTDRP